MTCDMHMLLLGSISTQECAHFWRGEFERVAEVVVVHVEISCYFEGKRPFVVVHFHALCCKVVLSRRVALLPHYEDLELICSWAVSIRSKKNIRDSLLLNTSNR